jgi:plasmid maintenance system antidote protein VapI
MFITEIKPQVECGCNNYLNRGFVLINRGLCDIQNMNEIGRLIKSRLAELRQTQDWLAEKVGVSNNAVTKWVKSGKISRDNAIKVARALQISVDVLLGFEQRQPSNEFKRQLIYFYDGMTQEHREIVLNLANKLYSLDNPDDRLASPFPTKQEEQKDAQEQLRDFEI